MVKVTLFALLSLVTLCNYVNSQEITPMLEILDAMEAMMTGGEYDRVYYEELTACMDFIDPAIKPSNDGAWQGVIDYWDTRGAANDPWGQNDLVYIEDNVTTTEIRGMTIYEPCGYTSNVAYYYPVTEICSRFTNGTAFSMPLKFVQSIASGFSQLVMGSAFMHGSHTDLGGQQDVSTLAAMAYEMHQASLDPLERSPILHDLAYDYRTLTATEMIENLDFMYTNMPVTQWREFTSDLGIPNYMLTYSGLVCTILTLAFDDDFVDIVIPIGAEAFGVPDEVLLFIEDYYIPEIRNATSNLNMNIIQRTRFLGNAAGTIAKLIYAFLWQEEVLTSNSFLFTPEANRIGMELLPEVNRRASQFQSFDHFSQDFQDGVNIYPGDARCNPTLPHPTWHLQSAIGLLDFVHLSDEMHKLLSTIEEIPSNEDGDIFY